MISHLIRNRDMTHKISILFARYDGATQICLNKDQPRTIRFYKTFQKYNDPKGYQAYSGNTIPPLLISYNNNGYVFMSDII